MPHSDRTSLNAPTSSLTTPCPFSLLTHATLNSDTQPHACYSPSSATTPLIQSLICVFGSLCFTVGSAAFWPSFGHTGSLIGNWTFRCGSCSYITVNTWKLVLLLMKCCKGHRDQSGLPIFSVCICIVFLCGGFCFLAGGIFFLIGHHDAEGSVSWALGSGLFLIGSLAFLPSVMGRCQ